MFLFFIFITLEKTKNNDMFYKKTQNNDDMFDIGFHFTDFCRNVYKTIEDVAISIIEMPIVQTYIFDIFYFSMKLITQLQSYLPSRKIKQPEPDKENWYYFGHYDDGTCSIKHYYSDIPEVHVGVKQTDLWIVKYNYKYISSTSHMILPNMSLSLIKSNISFIYMEYISNSNNSPISLHLPEEYLYVGNELFSPAFVLRLLEQQSEPYTFDCHYNLCIIDQQLRNIVLNYHQMIVLEKDNCFLVDLHR